MKEMYVQQEELNTMVNSLDKKLETYQKLESGNILDPPEVVQVPLKEPEIRTVEVKTQTKGAFHAYTSLPFTSNIANFIRH